MGYEGVIMNNSIFRNMLKSYLYACRDYFDNTSDDYCLGVMSGIEEAFRVMGYKVDYENGKAVARDVIGNFIMEVK